MPYVPEGSLSFSHQKATIVCPSVHASPKSSAEAINESQKSNQIVLRLGLLCRYMSTLIFGHFINASSSLTFFLERFRQIRLCCSTE
uniref:Uncharacterized protein n=1 Tax=Glossina palpalis gambiensis TaxID=67801 RepID=A0A1B0B032_9MUSC